MSKFKTIETFVYGFVGYEHYENVVHAVFSFRRLRMAMRSQIDIG